MWSKGDLLCLRVATTVRGANYAVFGIHFNESGPVVVKSETKSYEVSQPKLHTSPQITTRHTHKKSRKKTCRHPYTHHTSSIFCSRNTGKPSPVSYDTTGGGHPHAAVISLPSTPMPSHPYTAALLSKPPLVHARGRV